jgi:hypothetical protein
MDGDNIPDLTLVGGSNTIIHRGNGDGTFNPSQLASVSAAGIRVEVGDFDANGKEDFAVLSRSNSQIRVSLQNANGTFPAAPTNYATVSNPEDFSYGDVTGNGISDFIAPNANGLMTVLQGAAGGVFSALPNVAVPSSVLAARVADIDGNVAKDVVLGTGSGNGSIQTLLANGGGTFAAAVATSTGGPVPANGMLAADLDLDGKIDVAVTGTSRNIFSVHINNGDGTLQPARQYGTQAVAPEDIVVDASNPPNIYVLNRDSQSITRAINQTPGGTTDVPQPTPTPAAPPHRLAMAAPYPNPVNGVSVIDFTLAQSSQVDVNIYDVQGALVRKLLPRQELPAGSHNLRWDLRDESGRSVSAGVYFIRGHADGDVVSRRVMVLR